MSHHNNAVAKRQVPGAIVVNNSGEDEMAYLQHEAADGAIYKTAGCITYYRDTSGKVHLVTN